MEEFILGFPKEKEPTEGNIARYDNMQNAVGATNHGVSIYAENLPDAKRKFMELAERDYYPLTAA